MKSRHYDPETESSLKEAFDQLKKEDENLIPSKGVEQRLILELKSNRNRTSDSKLWFKAAAILILSLAAAVIWILQPELSQDDRPKLNSFQNNPDGGYLPLTYGLTAEESLQRVRVKLPRSALNDFGISLNQTRSDEVTADLLVGESGVPYAIRVVQQN